MYKKVVCLVLLLMLCMFSVASAIEIIPMWTLINSVANSLYIDSNGLATLHADISARRFIVQRIIISNYLQRFENNSWVTIKSWADEYIGDWASWTKQYYVGKGYTYRLVTYFNVTDGVNWEMTSLISNLQTY